MRFTITVLLLTICGCSNKESEEATPALPCKVTVQAYSLGENYEVVLRRDKETFEESFEILRAGEVVYREEGNNGLQSLPVYSLPALTGEERLLKEIDQDITGDGIPNLVVREFTGGIHCCHEDYIFSLGPEFVAFQSIFHGHGLVENIFVQADDDPALEIETRDYPFAWWRFSFSEIPCPDVLLDYRPSSDGRPLGWRFGNKKKPLADDKQAFYLAHAKRLSQSEDGPTDRVFLPEFTKTILDLIYTGNADFARRYAGIAFEGHGDQRLGFMQSFGDRLKHSKHFYGLLELNECEDVAELLAGDVARLGQ